MSVWANAAGKPQLTYAERLRRATQANPSAQSSSPSIPPSSPSPSLSASHSVVSSSNTAPFATASSAGAPSATSKPSTLIGANVSPKQTLVTSPMVPSSTKSAAVSPQTVTKELPASASRPGAPASTGSVHTGTALTGSEQRPVAPSRHEAGRGSISGASLSGVSSSPLSSHAVTASTSVNGDDAASTTHSINTESSSSAAPSTSTAPTSVNSPSVAASSMLSSSSSLANLAAISAASSVAAAAASTPANNATAPSGPPVNVWEVRKKAMLEKQKLQEEAQRKSREQAQLQAKQTKDTAKTAAAGGTAAASAVTTAQSGSSDAKGADRKQSSSGGLGKGASPSAPASVAGSRSVSASTAVSTNERGSKSGQTHAQAARGTTSQSANNRTSASTTAGAHARTGRHQPSSSTASAASISGLSSTAATSKQGRGSGAQQPGASEHGGDQSSTGDNRRPSASSAVANASIQKGGAKDAEKQTVSEKRRASEARSVASSAAHRNVTELSAASVGVDDSVDSRRIAAGDSGLDDLHHSSRSSNVDSTVATTPPSHLGETESAGSPSLHDTSSSTLNGAAMPFYSPLMGAHVGHRHMVYGHPHQHGAHHPYAADLGPIPLAPLPPPMSMSVASVTGTATPASSTSAGIMRSPPQPSADYDNTWLERIHMLNGGQNMPVYGPLTLASSKKRAEQDAEEEDNASKADESVNGKDDVTVAKASGVAHDTAAIALEKNASSSGKADDGAPTEQVASALNGPMLYPDTRSRARRRSSTGHKGRKAGALAALATAPESAAAKEKGSGGAVNASQGGDDLEGDHEAPDAAALPSIEDTEQKPSQLDAHGTPSDAALASVGGVAADKAPAFAAGITGAHSQKGSISNGPAGKGEGVVRSKNVTTGKKGKGPALQPAHGGSNVMESRFSAGAEASRTTIGTGEAEGKAAEGSGLQTTGGRKGPPSKPLDTQVTRALGAEGSGSSLSPRPAHLPATPPPSLAMPPLTSPGVNSPARGQSPFNSISGRSGHARMANGATHSNHSSYDYPPNGLNGLHLGMGASYNPAVAMAASMWNGSPSSPHPYYRPHRINKDGSFSPTRAVDYAPVGMGGGYYGGMMHDGQGHAGGSGYGGRGMGGKRGRGGRGGWRGGGAGSGPGGRNRDYSSSSTAAGQQHASVDHTHMQAVNGGYDPRYASAMGQVPHVYYVPYPVPVPYAAPSSRAESVDASTTTEGGAGATAAGTGSEQASDAGVPATPSATSTEASSIPAAGYLQWQQGMGMAYPYYNAMPFMANGMMPNAVPPDPIRAQALSQLDFYFSPRNLEGDFFLRQRMDSHGWVPIPVVAAFKKVRQITADVNVIRDAMQYSQNLEVDVDNWRVRKRYGWEEYVLPAEQQVAALSHEQAVGRGGGKAEAHLAGHASGADDVGGSELHKPNGEEMATEAASGAY
ncbi:hypothetical protein OC834_003799 [Tilletia horrida]|nr:hypothetical protein OC834_003799 [Tilletia horrida]